MADVLTFPPQAAEPDLSALSKRQLRASGLASLIPLTGSEIIWNVARATHEDEYGIYRGIALEQIDRMRQQLTALEIALGDIGPGAA